MFLLFMPPTTVELSCTRGAFFPLNHNQVAQRAKLLPHVLRTVFASRSRHAGIEVSIIAGELNIFH